MSDDERQSRAGGSDGDIEEEKAYIPRKPLIRPEDVKINEAMAKLMEGDLAQVHLHRILGAAADLDNENTVAEHIQKVFAVLIESYPHCAVQKIEEVSYLIRKGHDLSKFLSIDATRDHTAQANDLAAYIEKTRPIF